MRIPLYLALPLAFLSMGLVWWMGTKNKDFVTAPNAQTLASVREDALADLVAPDSIIADEDDASAIKVKPARLVLPNPEEIKPDPDPAENAIEPGDLTLSPGLDRYLADAKKGADAMVALATQLETTGESTHSLLAWERVLDATPASPEQQDIARKAIARLRPQLSLWNVDPLAAQAVVLHVSCDADRAKTIEPLLKEIATFLSASSSGLIDCQLKLQAGPKPRSDAPRQPLALSFQGSSADAVQSKTLTIPVLSDVPEEQRPLLLGNCYKLIRDGISARSELQALPEWQPTTDAASLLQHAITRRIWSVWAETFTPANP